jgi:hypothetical protein
MSYIYVTQNGGLPGLVQAALRTTIQNSVRKS